MLVCVCLCVVVCVCACVRACVCVSLCVCVWGGGVNAFKHPVVSAAGLSKAVLLLLHCL